VVFGMLRAVISQLVFPEKEEEDEKKKGSNHKLKDDEDDDCANASSYDKNGDEDCKWDCNEEMDSLGEFPTFDSGKSRKQSAIIMRSESSQSEVEL